MRTMLLRVLVACSVLAGLGSGAGRAAPSSPATTATACPDRVIATQHMTPSSVRLTDVAVVSATDMWAAGTIATTTVVTDTHGATSFATVPLVEHYDGHTWCAVDAASRRGVAASIGTSVRWSPGAAGKPWNEAAWATVRPLNRAGLAELSVIAASSPSNVWEADGWTSNVARAQYWNGRRWQRVLLPSSLDPGGMPLGPIATVSFTDTWLVAGPAELGSPAMPWHWDGRQWTAVPLPLAQPPAAYKSALTYNCAIARAAYLSLYAAVALAHNDVWFGGDAAGTIDVQYSCPLLYHWDGKGLHVVWAATTSADVALLERASIGWTVIALTAAGPHAVWALARVDDSDQTVLLRWDGKTWRVVSRSLTGMLTLSALNETNVWAVGQSCAAWVTHGKSRTCTKPVNAYHWDGRAWHSMAAVPVG